MSETYKISVEADVDDKVTPVIHRMTDALTAASNILDKYNAGLKSLGANSDNLAGSLDKAVEAMKGLGEGHGLTAAISRLGTMATSSAAIAKNMEAARSAGERMGASIAHGTSRLDHAATRGAGSWKVARKPGAVEAESAEPSAMASEVEAGIARRYALALAAVAGEKILAAGVDGLKKNIDIEDKNVKIFDALSLPPAQLAGVKDALVKSEFENFKKYKDATGGEILPFALSRMAVADQFPEWSKDRQDALYDAVMPFAAFSAKNEEKELQEIYKPLLLLADDAKMEGKEQAVPLFAAVRQAKLSTGLSTEDVVQGAQYAIPALDAAGGNVEEFMRLTATMMKYGMMNSESGSLLNKIAAHAFPEKLDSKLPADKRKRDALNELGLYKGDQAQFLQNGTVNEPLLMSMLAEASQRFKKKPEKFKSALHTGLGEKDELGKLAEKFFFDDATTDAKRSSLIDLKNKSRFESPDERPFDKNGTPEWLRSNSAKEKIDHIGADKSSIQMNAAAVWMPSVNAGLDKAVKASDGAADYTTKNPNFLKTLAEKLVPGLFASNPFLMEMMMPKFTNQALLKWAASSFSFAHRANTLPPVPPTPPSIPKSTQGPVMPEAGKAKMQESMDKANAAVKQAINVSVYLDSKEISSRMIASIAHGPSGFNGTASPMRG